MISFVVPAHNERASLGRTLEAIHEAARAVGQPYEIIVVDDASTDATPEIAAQNNAHVVRVNHRQIAATRNSGARATQGERYFSWMRTRQSIRALSPRHFELWTTARLAALRQRDLTPLRRFTRTCCCCGSVC
jgi:glycosyltransferase involved in cell wall biosynthesis